jgi:hypothetical protein
MGLRANRDKEDEKRGQWELEELEEIISKTMFAMYDKRFLPVFKPKNLVPHKVVSKGEIIWARKQGVYFHPSDTLFQGGYVDVKNYGLPEVGFLSMFRNLGEDFDDAFTNPEGEFFYPGIYLRCNTVRLRERIGNGYFRTGSGVPYVIYELLAAENGVGWSKDYVTVDQNTGKTNACRSGNKAPHLCYKPHATMGSYARGTMKHIPGGAVSLYTKEDEANDKHRSEFIASSSLNHAAESTLLWNVNALEGEALAKFGVHEEQVKSLFYARSLPMTETGRKRPILHWVASHRRRIKEGTDIDVKKHMRGITEFVMLDTKFTITNPPKKAEEREAKRLRRIADIERAKKYIYEVEDDEEGRDQPQGEPPIIPAYKPWYKRIINAMFHYLSDAV